MRRRKFLLGSSALVTGGGLLTSAGAFSSTTADRTVKIEIVGDEDAYLGLRGEQTDEGGLLFETDLPRTAPEQFDITNQTAGSVEMEIELLDGNLVFTAADPGDGVDSVTVEDETLTVSGMAPGAQVADVTIEIPARSDGVVTDTVSFDVTGEDGSLQIDAERALELERLAATVNFQGAITATFEIRDIDNVKASTVTANGYETNSKGGNRFKITDPERIDCEAGETTTITVRGETTDGSQFSGTATGVRCSKGGDNQRTDREDS